MASVCVLLVFFTGCVAFRYNPPELALLHVGMSEADVVQRIGKPTKTDTWKNYKTLFYEWNSPWDAKIGGVFAHIYFKDGEVIGADSGATESLSTSLSFGVSIPVGH